MTGSVKGNSLSYAQLHEIITLIFSLYGYNFAGYSKASFKRRVSRIMDKNNLTYYALKNLLINKPAFFDEFLPEITVNVTEMFRDPGFYKSVRENVLPYLSSFHNIKVWNAGCSSGEELYSFAILFCEEGLYERSFFYGTDINAQVLEKARQGVYDLRHMKTYSENFNKTGPKNSLSKYYTATYNAAAISEALKKNTLFSVHNLVTDNVFNEFQLVVCRNVLIYFDLELQEKVLNLLADSLCPLGFLCLGAKESIHFSSIKNKFKVIDAQANIYQKNG